MDKKNPIDINKPLTEKDSETQTFGCRAYNPNICKFSMSDRCAYTRKDGMCLEPPRTWKRRFKELKNKK